jgi:hypothetical protein
MRFKCLLLTFSCLSMSAAVAVEVAVRPVPEAEAHRGFLLGEYDPAEPTVTVFKDPLCGYCIAAMPKLEDLSGYNVYLFWAPIFGQRSTLSIDEIFRCDSPVDKSVRDTIAARKLPGCASEVDSEALAVNQNMVDAYRINSVPAYYFQGARVSLDELLQRQLEHPPVSGVAVNWDRYRTAKIRKRPESHSIALVLNTADEGRLLALDERFLPQFVFAESDPSTRRSYEELRLLLGQDGRQQGSFLVSRDGQIYEL